MVTLHLNDTVIKSLSNHELNILKYIYEHADEVTNLSIHALATRLSYSATTILRFCKKLGYSGYAEFKYALRAEIKKKAADTETGIAPSANHDFSTTMMIDSLSSNIEGTSKLISEDQLERAFQYLDSTCPIYLWAPGGITSILSDYFEKLLLSIGRQSVYKIESSKMGDHILGSRSAQCLLILISTTGDFGPTVRLGRIARMNNIPILSITPYTNNAVANLATVNFRFFTNQRENQGAEFTSRLPVFYVINAIIRSYLHYKQLAAMITAQEEKHDPII